MTYIKQKKDLKIKILSVIVVTGGLNLGCKDFKLTKNYILLSNRAIELYTAAHIEHFFNK